MTASATVPAALVAAALLLGGCSGTTDCDAFIAQDDGAGSSCSGLGSCPDVACPCDDGSTTTVSTCNNGACLGRAQCEEACGASKYTCLNHVAGGDAGGAAASGPWGCGENDWDTCEAGEYCLETFSGSRMSTGECEALPSGCDTCSCATDDAPTKFPTSNNCASGVTISCSQDGTQIDVGCHR